MSIAKFDDTRFLIRSLNQILKSLDEINGGDEPARTIYRPLTKSNGAYKSCLVEFALDYNSEAKPD